MLGLNYFKADASTHVIRTANGKIKAQGTGLSFFYNAATTSIAAVPISAQEAPFIFNLQTNDFQAITVQGQLTYQIAEPTRTAEVFNFTLSTDGTKYVSEDPLRLDDRVIRGAQILIQRELQGMTLHASLQTAPLLVDTVLEHLDEASGLTNLGLKLLDVAITNIAPTPETAKALEAHAREAILKEADDAIYARRKSAVEQERTIKDAELQTELAVQQKEQEIASKALDNERDRLRSQSQTQQERITAEIEAETRRQELVDIKVDNTNKEADAEAYAISARMKAFQALPVEHLKAMALSQMNPDQLMALAFNAFAENAEKIGELNLGPEMFAQGVRRAVQKAAQR